MNPSIAILQLRLFIRMEPDMTTDNSLNVAGVFNILYFRHSLKSKEFIIFHVETYAYLISHILNHPAE